MRALIAFNKPLESHRGRGWRPTDSRHAFPFAVVESVGGRNTLALKPHTRMTQEGTSLTLTWVRPDESIDVTVDAGQIDSLVLKG